VGNFVKTVFLLAVLTVLVVVLGQAIGGREGALLAFAIALVMNFASYWWSDRIVMALHGAQEVSPEEAPELHAIVERLAANAGIPKPRVCVVDDPSPNAFATGRGPGHAAICATSGILDLLDRRELEGVLAHELGHVRNRDILIGTIAAALAGAVTILSDWLRWSLLWGGSRRDDDREGGSGLGAMGALAAMILAPLAALLVQLAISRSREYEADATGARLAGSPEGLARALAKIDRHARPLATATSGTAHLFISNPFAGLGGIRSLFSTHPPMEERIRRLRAMEGTVLAP
jgi:heat shock protein HtpX